MHYFQMLEPQMLSVLGTRLFYIMWSPSTTRRYVLILDKDQEVETQPASQTSDPVGYGSELD